VNANNAPTARQRQLYDWLRRQHALTGRPVPLGPAFDELEFCSRRDLRRAAEGMVMARLAARLKVAAQGNPFGDEYLPLAGDAGRPPRCELEG
jgi:hypothetical protein